MASRAPTTSGSSEPHAPPHHKAPEKSEHESAKAREETSEEPRQIAGDLMDERAFVQFTGLATAYLRAAESARPDRLINDPFAEKLSGDVASQLMSFVSRWGPSSESAMDMLAIRTRYLDEALANRNQDISQVVILASGMDSRAYRLEALKGCHVLEIDQSQEYMDQKKRTLQEMSAEPIAKKVDYIVADLANDAWETLLIARGFNPKQPTFWCLEGMLYYLDRSSIVKVLETMDALSAAGSQFWVDMCGKSTLKSDQFAVQGLKFGEDNPKEGILARIHWDLDIVASFDQPGAHFGRKWEPLKLSEKADDTLEWFFLMGKKPPNPDVAPLL